MKKFLSGLLAIIIAIFLVGCTSVSSKENIKNESSNLQEEEESTSLEKEITEEANKETVNSEPKKEEVSINKKVVVIDPGHSSNGNKEMEKESPDSSVMKIKDPGGAQGVSTNVPEYVVAMKVSLKLKQLLEQNNITVIMTKTQDAESPGNIDRAEVGNKNNANLSIRMHCDSADSQSARGASMLTPSSVGYAKEISGISKRYGEIILDNLVSTAGMKNRGVIERKDLTGFNWSRVPVVLVEMGFMSNPEEDRLLNDDNYQNKLAQGLCNGILKALQ